MDSNNTVLIHSTKANEIDEIDQIDDSSDFEDKYIMTSVANIPYEELYANPKEIMQLQEPKEPTEHPIKPKEPLEYPMKTKEQTEYPMKQIVMPPKTIKLAPKSPINVNLSKSGNK